MAIFSRVKNWVSNEVLTASDLNGEFNNLLTNTKPESIEDYSADVTTMRLTTDPGGVGTESLATSLAGEIERLRFVLKRIVGGAQYYSTPDFDLTGTLGTANIADSAITTAKVNNGAITAEKLAANVIGYSTPAVSFSGTSTSPADVTNLSVSFTTNGNPIEIKLQSSGAGNSFFSCYSANVNDPNVFIFLYRGATEVVQTYLKKGNPSSSGLSNEITLPPAAILNHTDTPAAGTYTYKIMYSTGGATTALDVANTVLVVRQLNG